jgi:DNA-binding transcriptional ArsR family regulator
MEQIDYVKHSLVLKALSHPVRLKILRVLFDNEFCVNDLSNKLNLPQAISSHHLGIMKNSGILCSHKQGSKAYYSIKNDLAKGIISILRKN